MSFIRNNISVEIVSWKLSSKVLAQPACQILDQIKVGNFDIWI